MVVLAGTGGTVRGAGGVGAVRSGERREEAMKKLLIWWYRRYWARWKIPISVLIMRDGRWLGGQRPRPEQLWVCRWGSRRAAKDRR